MARNWGWVPGFAVGALFVVMALLGVPMRGTESPLVLAGAGLFLMVAWGAAGLFRKR